MSDEARQDLLVGLLIVSAIGVVIGALIATSGWLERRYALFMRAASAEGLSVDSKVIVQGLEIGRVTRIVPRVDPNTRAIAFVARLSLAERFADGSRLQLPVGTRAEIVQVSTISTAAAVRLVLPEAVSPGRATLAQGDTIDSERKGSALDQVTAVAGQLSKEVTEVLRQTHRTLARVEQTVIQTTPEVTRTIAGLARVTGRLDTLLAQVNSARFADSLSATLATSNRLMLRLDSLTQRARTMTAENEADLRTSVTNLAQATRQLNHFVEQMSRRPYRLLTGVRPLPAARDSVSRADP